MKYFDPLNSFVAVHSPAYQLEYIVFLLVYIFGYIFFGFWLVIQLFFLCFLYFPLNFTFLSYFIVNIRVQYYINFNIYSYTFKITQ
nr:MAG TPA: hypothetical protein [Caudoviricetes sp.]